MIELNPEQRQAVAEGEAVRVVDPLTQDAYVVVRAEVFARMSSVPPRPHERAVSEIPPQILRSQQAFWHDLPELLKNKRNRGKWAAYYGQERVALTRSDLDAYQECFRRGLKHGDFYVGLLELDPDGIPPWGTYEGDRSFFEVTDELPHDPA